MKKSYISIGIIVVIFLIVSFYKGGDNPYINILAAYADKYATTIKDSISMVHDIVLAKPSIKPTDTTTPTASSATPASQIASSTAPSAQSTVPPTA